MATYRVACTQQKTRSPILTKRSFTELSIDDDILPWYFPVVQLQTGMAGPQNAESVHPSRVFLHPPQLFVESEEDDNDEAEDEDSAEDVENGQRLPTSGSSVVEPEPLVQRRHVAEHLFDENE